MWISYFSSPIRVIFPDRLSSYDFWGFLAETWLLSFNSFYSPLKCTQLNCESMIMDPWTYARAERWCSCHWYLNRDVSNWWTYNGIFRQGLVFWKRKICVHTSRNVFFSFLDMKSLLVVDCVYAITKSFLFIVTNVWFWNFSEFPFDDSTNWFVSLRNNKNCRWLS